MGNLMPVSERTGGFSGGKAVLGAVLVGPIGLAAGALGKKKRNAISAITSSLSCIPSISHWI